MSSFLNRLHQKAQEKSSVPEASPAVPETAAPRPAEPVAAGPSESITEPVSGSSKFKFKLAPRVAAPVAIQVTTASEDVAPVDFQPGPVGFQNRLEALDRLCQDSAGITSLTHDAVKAHVGKLMTDLLQNPEMKGLVLDRDLHNIMLFVQASSNRADKKFEAVAVKRQKVVNKKNSAASNFEAAFDDMLALPAPTLDSISNLNTDSIPTKVK